jgi:hypothetical protein
VSIRAEIQRGYHVNSHEPTDEYIIPLKLTWTADPLEVVKITYPKPELESYSFSKVPLSVFTGDFDIKTQFQVPDQVPGGNRTVTGKLRYQACTDNLCLPPKTVPVTVNVTIE